MALSLAERRHAFVDAGSVDVWASRRTDWAARSALLMLDNRISCGGCHRCSVLSVTLTPCRRVFFTRGGS